MSGFTLLSGNPSLTLLAIMLNAFEAAQRRREVFWSGTGTGIEVCSVDQNHAKCRKFFHHLVWMGSCSTFMLHCHCFVVSVTISLSTWKGHVSWLKGLFGTSHPGGSYFRLRYGIRRSLCGARVSWYQDAKKVVQPKLDRPDQYLTGNHAKCV